MAKMFLNPQILECDIDKTETNDLFGSGITVDTGDWKIRLEYRNHNTGHHSEIAFIGDHSGSHTGNFLKMNVMMRSGTGYVFSYVKDSGDLSVSNVSSNGFSITRHNFYNPTEHFEFNIQVVVKNEALDYEGAIGKTGEERPCDFVCVSIVEG